MNREGILFPVYVYGLKICHHKICTVNLIFIDGLCKQIIEDPKKIKNKSIKISFIADKCSFVFQNFSGQLRLNRFHLVIFSHVGLPVYVTVPYVTNGCEFLRDFDVRISPNNVIDLTKSS